MEFKDSKTKKNLEAAFSGESQARNMYYYFASVARKEGFEQISQIFLEAAENEKEHAKIWFKYLDGIKNTDKQFSKEAEEEGFLEIAEKFRLVGEVEKEHEKIFSKLLENIQRNEVFTKKTGIHVWKCRNCGYIHCGLCAPKICPVCSHKQSYFELNSENY